MDKPRLLDLFCGAGGCAKGYQEAGFYVVGVDINPQPHYCGDEFYQADALEVLDILLSGGIWQGYRLSDFAVIHASPPCQGYSVSRFIAAIQVAKEHPLLIMDVRKRLESSRLPWIIENVAFSGLPDALELCGSMFDLPIRRHRWFSSSHLLFAPKSCKHLDYCINPVGKKVRGYGLLASKTTYLDKQGRTRKRESYLTLADGQKAMEINWMTLAELSQAIPPAYTAWIGAQLMDAILQDREVAV